MKKYLLLITLILTPFYAHSVEVSGNFTLGSDYIWRGVSQKGGAAMSAGIEAEQNGWYTGVWASQVDYGDNSDYEYDFYTGFSYDINDELAIDVGVIQYNFNNEPDNKLEEWYAGGTFRGFTAYYYEDLDNSDNHFAEYSYAFPIETVSLAFFWQDPNDFYGINIGKDFENYTITATYGEGRDDNKSAGGISVAYNF
jgi:uncharacterized protein (TIGR02001 family)|tara:strand:- start:759 stop:1349 length:591 start_codon:yes stop_codon:yes gene_type:complete